MSNLSTITYEQLRFAVYLVGIPIIVYLCLRIVRRVRDIRSLDAKLRAEEQARLDAALRGDKPLNPYADMAALYGIQVDENGQVEDRKTGTEDRKGRGERKGGA